LTEQGKGKDKKTEKAEKNRKQNVNMLEGSLWDKILIYAFPIAATGILQQLFNAADIAVVGRFTGDIASLCMAAVGANTPIVGLILNLFIGIAMGSNVVIATAVGGKDRETLRRAAGNSIVIALVGGVLMAALGELIAVPLLQSQNVPQEVLPLAAQYLRIYFAGMPVILLYNFAAAVYRGIGNTKTPLIALTLSGLLNVVLNLFFVIGLGRNVDGVAIATVISNAVSAVFLFIGLMRKNGIAAVRLSDFKPDRRILGQIMHIGIPTGIQMAVFAVANMIIQSAINSLGTVVMAASSAAFNIEVFAYYLLNAFSQSCTTFVGQNNGAGNRRRCRSVLKLCLLEDLIFTLLSIALILFFGRQMLGLFNPDAEVVSTGYTRLLWVFSAYGFSMVYENIDGYLRGFGMSLIPSFLTVIGVCGIRTVWIFTVFQKYQTFTAIISAYPVSMAATAVFLIIAVLILRPSVRKTQPSR
jgi:putative MATE family efflux protein